MQVQSKRTVILAAIAGVAVLGLAGWWIGGRFTGKPAPQPDPVPEVASAAQAPADAPAVVEQPPVVAPAPDAGGVAANPGRQRNQNIRQRGNVQPPVNNGNQQVVTLGGRDVTLPPGMQVTQNVGGDPNATAIQLPGRNGNNTTIQITRGGANGGGALQINGRTINLPNLQNFRQGRNFQQPAQGAQPNPNVQPEQPVGP